MKTTEVHSFFDINMGFCKLPIITVYYNTSDFPGKYVGRLFDVDQRTSYAVIKDNLKAVHEAIPRSFQRMERDVNDDPVILEVWI